MTEREKHIGKVVSENIELVRLIDEGGMGAVYLGRHTVLGRPFAVKFLHGELLGQASLVERFVREGKAASSIRHPNIIDVTDIGTSEWGEPYLVMEYLSGENLAELLERKRPLGLAAACAVMEPTLRALGAAHEHGIVHRDLKPENIFIAKMTDSPPVIKLIDFGISKFAPRDDLSKLTRTGILLGTPSFMSPEQARGKGGFDHRSDIYSTGVIFYLMLTGELPFKGESYNDLIFNIIGETPKKPTEVCPDVPPDVEPIIEKLLEKEPAKRYETCRAVIEALEKLEGYEKRVEALVEAMRDMPEDRFATGDLGPLKTPRDDLAATVFAGGSGGVETISLEKPIDTLPPGPMSARRHDRSSMIIVLILFFVLGFGVIYYLTSDMLFPGAVASEDAEDDEVSALKEKLADLKSAADRSEDAKPGPQDSAASTVPVIANGREGSKPSDTAVESPKDTSASSEGKSEGTPAETDTALDPGIQTGAQVESGDALHTGPKTGGSEQPPAEDKASSPTQPSAAPGSATSAKSTASAAREPVAEPPKIVAEPIVLTPDDVDQLVESKSAEIESCYDQARRIKTDLKGKLLIKVTVSGPVVRASILTNELTDEMGLCVLKAVRAVAPPPNKGDPVTIVKEILFRVKSRGAQ